MLLIGYLLRQKQRMANHVTLWLVPSCLPSSITTINVINNINTLVSCVPSSTLLSCLHQHYSSCLPPPTFVSLYQYLSPSPTSSLHTIVLSFSIAILSLSINYHLASFHQHYAVVPHSRAKLNVLTRNVLVHMRILKLTEFSRCISTKESKMSTIYGINT